MGQIRFTLDGVDLTPPTLSGVTATPSGTSSASWSVNTDEAGGTIFAAARAIGTGQLSQAEIENGTGGAVATATNTSPSQAATNSGTLNGLAPSTTYRVDLFHRDISGNESTVISSSAFTTQSTGAASVTIETLQLSGLAAPCGAFLEAHVAGFNVSEDLNLSEYDPSFHRLLYRWTFTRQGQAYTPQASDKVVNLPAAHNDTNTAYGKRVGHVFTEPGTYTVTCEVRDSAGTTGQGATTITVEDPDTVFAGNRTILLGAANGAYPGAQVVNSTSAAVSAIAGLGNTGRILIQRGSTHANGNLEFSGSSRNVYIGTYGSGPRPVVGQAGQHGVRVNGSFQGHIQIQGIEIAGNWDSTTETGNGGGQGVRTFGTNNEQWMVCDDLVVHGFGEGIFSPRSDNPNTNHATYIHNCDVYGNRFYCGHLVTRSLGCFYSATGCALRNQEQDMMGGPKDGTYNNHGSIRFAEIRYAYVAACDMFTRVGWNPSIRPEFGPFMQSAVRWNTAVSDENTGVFERLALENGWSWSAGNGGFGNNVLVDKCLIVGHAKINSMMVVESTGLTVRNTIFAMPDVPRATDTWNAAIDCIIRGTLNDPNWPVEFYNNTFALLQNDANRDGVALTDIRRRGGAFNVFTDDNNILYTPNASGQASESMANVSTAVMQCVGGNHDARFAGIKFRASSISTGSQTTMDGTYASPAGFVSDFRPSPGAAALSGASGVCAIDDFYGTIRPVPTSNKARGAVEGI